MELASSIDRPAARVSDDTPGGAPLPQDAAQAQVSPSELPPPRLPKAPRFVLSPQDPTRAGELGRACAISPAIAQVLLNRGILEESPARLFLAPKLAHLTLPDAMLDRALAAQRLAEAVRKRERIVVFGDYDVDGTTSAAVLSGILEALGAEVRTLLANRFEGGYGLSDQALDRCLALRPRVLVTCDCGSSDHDRVARARAAGVDVIVVDHHLVPERALEAVAFLNPHRPECGFPYKGLCSAGLALSLGAALRVELKANLDLREWLDLVALGTIADVAPLDGDNRALVRSGLVLLGSDAARPGIIALREAAKIRAGTQLSAVDVAFRMTPRLNAAGRLGDPAITLALLRATTLDQARALAIQIERINGSRKDFERHATEAAVAQIGDSAGHRSGLVAAGEGWHRGVVGISAARLVDRYFRPSLVLAVDGAHAHGSGRAPDGFPLHAALLRVSHLLDKFGGHDAAVGLTIRSERIPQLREAFDEACAELSVSVADEEQIAVDARLDGAGYMVPLAAELSLLEPLGESNPEPVFEAHAELLRADVVGTNHLKLALRIGHREVSAFGFDLGPRKAELGPSVRLFGNLRPDSYRGGDRVELRILHLENNPS
ncbi:MAG: Single-stranded-DNA-specific exonuclease RecJ [Myxococcaceae bacterium]|nr:Single-stranded-DNA-specific exonuclease RecJ [Myxococcaceae bacterium]